VYACINEPAVEERKVQNSTFIKKEEGNGSFWGTVVIRNQKRDKKLGWAFLWGKESPLREYDLGGKRKNGIRLGTEPEAYGPKVCIKGRGTGVIKHEKGKLETYLEGRKIASELWESL